MFIEQLSPIALENNTNSKKSSKMLFFEKMYKLFFL